MAVADEAVVLFADLLRRIDVYHSHVEVAQLMHEAVVDLSGDGVALLDR